MNVEQTNPTNALSTGMWCDDFDADLLKIFPGGEIERLLAPLDGMTLYTHSRLTNGKINMPCVWNGHEGFIAFFGTGPDTNTFKSESFWTDTEVVSCTALEMLRDWWPHSYNIFLDGVWVLGDLGWRMMALMYQLRGWNGLADGGAEHRREVLRAVARMVERIQNLDALKNRPPREAKSPAASEEFTWFESAKAGPDCLCSGCEQAIPEDEMLIRLLSEDHKREARLCTACAEKFFGMKIDPPENDNEDPFWDE